MKKGLLALMLLALVAAIPACKQRDCNDKDRGCNPCKIFTCKKKCDDKPERKKKKSCCPSFCDMFRCKKKCDKNEMEEETVVREERVVREELAPRRMQ